MNSQLWSKFVSISVRASVVHLPCGVWRGGGELPAAIQTISRDGIGPRAALCFKGQLRGSRRQWRRWWWCWWRWWVSAWRLSQFPSAGRRLPDSCGRHRTGEQILRQPAEWCVLPVGPDVVVGSAEGGSGVPPEASYEFADEQRSGGKYDSRFIHKSDLT